MKLFYYCNKKFPNFGDEINSFLWPQLFGDVFDERDEDLFIGIGTILDQRIPALDKKIVFGAGVRSIACLPAIDETWDIRFVRGERSAAALGNCESICDGAYCLRLLPWPVLKKRHKVSFVPWFLNRGLEWKLACRKAGFHYIDPCRSVCDIIDEIRSSECIIAEAMHGAIVADCFRVPWIRIKSLQHQIEAEGVTEWKWAD
ncbi:polysaccharide pyruvyl transferase family protein [Rosistilla ulvae]|uniref:polysaccharide pyruvyl transferase family protein n=1 Tax=Rosistilla ulvae TaxID=1930277 RepID=UPI001C54E9F5|nr:polysaccharide pyruvyl transferase family protein [Rosistilla ulvae]